MNWRTDKPTTKLIVAYLEGDTYPRALHLEPDEPLYYDYYFDSYYDHYPTNSIVKWADLEEDETVTDCNELKEEVKKYINNNWECGHSNENAPLYLYDFSDKDLLDAARHFAKWGAEHLKK